MDFLDVLTDKIEELKSEENKARKEMFSPDFHIAKISTAIEAIIPEVESLPEDSEVLRREFVSVLTQIPRLCADNWSEVIKDLQDKREELNRWNGMMSLYEEWQEQQATTPEDALTAAVVAGDIPEPSRSTGIRRKPGTKPPISLGRHRRITSNLESGEDSEG